MVLAYRITLPDRLQHRSFASQRGSLPLGTYELSPKSRSKVKSCLRAIDLLGIDRADLLRRYRDHCFRTSAIAKDELFGAILDGGIKPDQQAFLARVCNLPYHRDARSSVEYGVDLALGWMLEDCVAHRLKSYGAVIALTGHDREREYLLAKEISQEPDLRVTWRGKVRRVEVMCDWLDTWLKQDHLDLRDSKFTRLRSENTILLGVAPLSANGLALETGSGSNAFQFNPSIPGYGGKPGYTAHGVSSCLVPVAEAIQSLLHAVANGLESKG